MFFIETIRRKRAEKKAEAMADMADAMSRHQMLAYFDMGQFLFKLLMQAEEIVGSKRLGVTSTEIGPPPEFGYTATFPVDEHLTAVFHRIFNENLAIKLGRAVVDDDSEKKRFVSVHFKVDDFDVQNPEKFTYLCDITKNAILRKIEEYKADAQKHLEDYLSAHQKEAAATTET